MPRWLSRMPKTCQPRSPQRRRVPPHRSPRPRLRRRPRYARRSTLPAPPAAGGNLPAEGSPSRDKSPGRTAPFAVDFGYGWRTPVAASQRFRSNTAAAALGFGMPLIGAGLGCLRPSTDGSVGSLRGSWMRSVRFGTGWPISMQRRRNSQRPPNPDGRMRQRRQRKGCRWLQGHCAKSFHLQIHLHARHHRHRRVLGRLRHSSLPSGKRVSRQRS